MPLEYTVRLKIRDNMEGIMEEIIMIREALRLFFGCQVSASCEHTYERIDASKFLHILA